MFHPLLPGKEAAGETELHVELQKASMAELVGAIQKVKAKFDVPALPDDQAQLEMLIFGALSADFLNKSSYSMQAFRDQEDLRTAVCENLIKDPKKHHIDLHAYTEVGLAEILPELATVNAAGGKRARYILIWMSCALPGKDNEQTPLPLEILLYAGGRGAAK